MLQNKTDLSVLEKEDKLNFQYHNYYTRVSFEKSVENLMINTLNILTMYYGFFADLLRNRIDQIIKQKLLKNNLHFTIKNIGIH